MDSPTDLNVFCNFPDENVHWNWTAETNIWLLEVLNTFDQVGEDGKKKFGAVRLNPITIYKLVKMENVFNNARINYFNFLLKFYF